ncbi:MAG: hypothetical protein QOK37_2039 [Thermoanaerobaculia bacterium]|jgi:hypothetical protein|nr:hypothetical protein [Thermoanaerobaculia bacterium]
MRCVILQPSYIPWRGYFDLIRRADVFVFYDDVQYDKHGWRNRNRIKTPQGTQWITIPVRSKSNVVQGLSIGEVRIAGNHWEQKHRRTLTQNYRSAPFFDDEILNEIYDDPPELLCELTIRSTIALARRLGYTNTQFFRSSDFGFKDGRTDRLIAILRHLGATEYLSGPSASDYIDQTKFDSARIKLEWIQYDYPEYPQLYPPFDPLVSIIDLMFMTGPDAARFISRI